VLSNGTLESIASTDFSANDIIVGSGQGQVSAKKISEVVETVIDGISTIPNGNLIGFNRTGDKLFSDGGSISDVLRFVAQTLTAQQKAQAKVNLDLGNVNNTSDAAKPVSTAVAGEIGRIDTSLNQKLNLSGGTLTGSMISRLGGNGPLGL